MMVLIPEEDLGFFVVYNRYDDAFREQLISAFFDHYYPAQSEGPVPQAVEMSSQSLECFAGSYRWVKYPRSTLGKAIALVPGAYPVVVRANEDTSLSLSFFGADADVPLQNTAFEKLAWYESAEAQLGTLGSLLLLFASAVVVWPLGALIDRLRKRTRAPDPARRRALWVGWVGLEILKGSPGN
jgi:hypothetical protein